MWSESHSVLSDSLRPHGLYSPWNSIGQNTGVGSLSLLQEVDPNPGMKSRSPALQADSLLAEPQGKPKNTGMGSLSLLQQIFPTQESNWSLLHWGRVLYQLNHQGSPHKSKLAYNELSKTGEYLYIHMYIYIKEIHMHSFCCCIVFHCSLQFIYVYVCTLLLMGYFQFSTFIDKAKCFCRRLWVGICTQLSWFAFSWIHILYSFLSLSLFFFSFSHVVWIYLCLIHVL